MGATSSSLPPDNNDIHEPVPLTSESSFEDTYISPGGFETPKSEMSDTEIVPHVKQETLDEKPTHTQEEHEVSRDPLAVVTITNVKNGAAIDISGGDGKSIIGFPLHGGENQQWRIDKMGEGHAIVNPHSGQYLHLTFENDGIRSSASCFPLTWRLQKLGEVDHIYQVLWHSGELALHLENGTPGTRVQLRPTNPEDESQVWKLTPCGSIVGDESKKLHQSLSPQIVDTVITLDGGSKTIRTTTTITTVTTVTEAPCVKCL
ncbi:unnamed protein product [Somion occarium]|uniref:Ricin B lectin domain-containing protein n=1 Tax=Somion occarium TaxID=3059160 RepID=A0ABP1D3U2_9APHY